ncbi:MAG: hypothetical protein IGS39_16615 [Calothrix sp. C42_A2020_038]|nr:hypothetical protein [Calothrix sp. C42_A2020_038]
MEPNQQEQRLAANQDFLKSLNELEDILQENLPQEGVSPYEINQTDNKKQITAQTSVSEPDEIKIDLAAWEDAVADIEKYLESKEKGDE